MGSTGHGLYGKYREAPIDEETFGVLGAVAFKGKIPANTGLEPVGSNKITLKVPAIDGNSVLFQFKLNKSGDLMTIIGYKNGVPEVKCKVAVDSGSPSLDEVIATGSNAEKAQATKMKDLFAKSTEIKEYQLGSIANKLIQDKRAKEGS